jgi:hypothetical protein
LHENIDLTGRIYALITKPGIQERSVIIDILMFENVAVD